MDESVLCDIIKGDAGTVEPPAKKLKQTDSVQSKKQSTR